MTDMVCPLGAGTIWDDNEIRYSLRSVAKFMPDIRRVFLVGRWPKAGIQDRFPFDLVHIPARDLNGCKEVNIKDKLLLACRHPDVSDKFLLWNDDYFLLQPCSSAWQDWPNYAEGTLEGRLRTRISRDIYWKSMDATRRALNQRALRTHYFDVHCPIVYDKALFPQVMARYAPEWDRPEGLVIKSLYGNALKLKPTPFKDLKIDVSLTEAEIRARVAGRALFSVGNRGLNHDMCRYLKELAPRFY